MVLASISAHIQDSILSVNRTQPPTHRVSFAHTAPLRRHDTCSGRVEEAVKSHPWPTDDLHVVSALALCPEAPLADGAAGIFGLAASPQKKARRAKAWTTADINFQCIFGAAYLTPLRQSHSPWMHHHIFNQQDVLRWLCNGKSWSYEETQQFIFERAESWRQGSLGGWLVCVGGEPAGYFACGAIVNKQLTVDYAFAPKFCDEDLTRASVLAALSYLAQVETPFRWALVMSHPHTGGSYGNIIKAGFKMVETIQREDNNGVARSFDRLARQSFP